MKKILVLVFLCHFGYSQTNISGNISGTLYLANSPYLVQGHLMIQPNNTLTIQPGVVIEFQNFFKLNVQGSLLAKGTSSDSITFKMKPAMANIGWWGIRFEMTGTSQDSSIFEYCKISGGRATGNGDDLNGGGIFVKFFNKVRVSRSRIFDNMASNGAGIELFYSSAIIDNNNISNNTTHGAWSSISGGGIHCDSLSNARITNNTISNNSVNFGGWGGGIGCTSSSPYIFNNTIHHNNALPAGGGISIQGTSTPTITNNQINYNTAGSGGGINIKDNSSPIIKENTIRANSVYTSSSSWNAYGGGICIEGTHGLHPKITKNLIFQNYGGSDGGAIYCSINSLFSDLAITGNTIHANNSNNYGGALSMAMKHANYIANNVFSNNISGSGGAIFALLTDTMGIYVNNLFINNTSLANGGALYLEGSSPKITNCTFASNLANTLPSYTTYIYGGGGVFCRSISNPIFTNCILWGNRAISQNGDQLYLEDNASDPDIISTDLEGGSNGMYTNGSVYSGTFTNNINSNPLFVAPTLGTGNTFTGTVTGWSLQVTSPCINSGKTDTTGLLLPLTDIVGQPRVKGITDLGAFETSSCAGFVVNPAIIITGPSLSVTLPGNSYQWVDCNSSMDSIAGAITSVYTPTSNGSYAVNMTQFGCTGTSSCISMTTVFIDEFIKPYSEFYPNPAHDKLFINSNKKSEIIVSVYDILGKLLIKETLDKSGYLDVSKLPRTIYLVAIEAEAYLVRHKLILE